MDSPLGFRFPPELKTKFLQKSVKHGGPSTVVRTLVEAYVDDRITIAPKAPTEQDLLK
jgi:hypothetical protein